MLIGRNLGPRRRDPVQPQGLCFVTGKTGLIPRCEQHKAFETALSVFERHIQKKAIKLPSWLDTSPECG